MTNAYIFVYKKELTARYAYLKLKAVCLENINILHEDNERYFWTPCQAG